MERIGVLHDELAAAHDAEARPYFIAELQLDLVEIDRQLAIALELTPRDIGDDLFVRRADDEVALVAVLQAQQLRSVLIPATRLLPELSGLNRAQQQFQGAGAIHLLANDGFHFAQRSQ